MKYKLLHNQVNVKQTNPIWIIYLLIPLTFLGYYFFRKSFKFDGTLSEIIATSLLFIIIYAGGYLIGFVLPRKRFKKNLIGHLTINEKNWSSPSTSIGHEEIESITIYHDFVKRNTYTYDGNNYAWYISIKLNDAQFAFFVESNSQIEHLRKCIASYYKKGIDINESFGESNLHSFVLVVCENDDDIKKVKER